MQLGDANGALEKFHRSLDVLRLMGSAELTPTIEQEAATTQALSSVVERRRGDDVAAEKGSTEALARIERVLSASSASAELKQKAARLKSWIEQQDPSINK